jgi:hypothetical protein
MAFHDGRRSVETGAKLPGIGRHQARGPQALVDGVTHPAVVVGGRRRVSGEGDTVRPREAARIGKPLHHEIEEFRRGGGRHPRPQRLARKPRLMRMLRVERGERALDRRGQPRDGGRPEDTRAGGDAVARAYRGCRFGDPETGAAHERRLLQTHAVTLLQQQSHRGRTVSGVERPEPIERGRSPQAPGGRLGIEHLRPGYRHRR